MEKRSLKEIIQSVGKKYISCEDKELKKDVGKIIAGDIKKN